MSLHFPAIAVPPSNSRSAGGWVGSKGRFHLKYLPQIWSALWRKPVGAVLIWLAVVAAFTLFGLMVGLHATYDRLLESSRMDRLDVNIRFPSPGPHGVLLPIALREQIAQIDGVSAVGTYFWLWGYYRDPHQRARIIAVDEPMRADRSMSWEFHVLGVVPDDPRTGAFILGNYSYVDRARPLQDQGYASGFGVAVRNAARADDVSLRIDRHFADSSTPTTTIPDKADMQYVVSSGVSLARRTWAIGGAGIFVILLLTASGMTQSVRERTTEFAVLTALPAQYLPRDLSGIPKPTLSPELLTWSLGCAAMLALASAAIPMSRLRRLSVTDALAGR